ncbi:hypothetical protein [Nitratifractor sp.]
MFKSLLRFVGRWLLRLLLLLVALLFLAYWIVPPLTEKLYDTAAIRQKVHTQMLPSDQPRQIRLSKEEKRIFRAMHLDTYLGTAAHALIDLPAFVVHYLSLTPVYRPLPRGFFGLFVDGAKNDPEAILSSLRELGVRSVGLRVYLNPSYLDSRAYRRQLALAQKLHGEGKELLLVLAQTYESFEGPVGEKLRRVVSDFAPYVDLYQIGEAVNRSKWGIPDRDDYLAFVNAAFDAIATFDPGARTLGPSVIDFEWFYTLYFYDLAGRRFDILNTLLYVDRVRQPENEQHGFDTEEKIRLFKAVDPAKPLWITEVNWPLKGTGKFSPTSSKEAVPEEAYRDYMARYLLIAAGSGYTERVYWWQLFARGYGLADHLNLRKRPAYRAFATLVKVLEGSTPAGHSIEGGLYDYRFRRGENTLHFFWTRDGGHHPLPERFRCRDLEGRPLPSPAATATPIYCEERP